MKRNIPISLAAIAAVFALTGCGGNSSSFSPGIVQQAAQAGAGAPQQVSDYHLDPNVTIPDTTVPVDGQMHTNFLILNTGGGLHPAATPSGYSPAQLRSAYGLPSTGGTGTIVLVDAYDDPYALADFNAYSAQFGLPQETSTSVTASTNQHFQVVYEGGRKPSANSGWSQEESLDIEMAHAMAPNAKIVLVEASSASGANLYASDDLAATLPGVRECSNSWGGGEASNESSSDSHFSHAGVVYFFSAGDSGGVREYPAASPNVVAVGGTSLKLTSSGTRASETVWNGTGCGPSSYEARPSFQSAVASVVGTKRGIADISAVADPNTGVAVHWNNQWLVFGGTSVASPLVAGMSNLAGTNRGSGPAQNTQFYAKLGSSDFFDVTSGSAGSYSAKSGYDFPTGVGAPKGLGGF